MDILIKNMKMPKSCEGCFACEEFSYECYDYCNILKAPTTRGERRKDCPLVALPEHGDLIDRDALIKDSWASYMLKKKNDDSSRVQYDTLMGYEIRSLLEDAHTILEASNG